MTAQHKAWSPSGSFINDDKLHSIVDSALSTIIAKLDAEMQEAQAILNGKGGLTLKSPDYLSGVTFRKAFSMRSTEDTAHVLTPLEFRTWYVNSFRKVNMDFVNPNSVDPFVLRMLVMMAHLSVHVTMAQDIDDSSTEAMAKSMAIFVRKLQSDGSEIKVPKIIIAGLPMTGKRAVAVSYANPTWTNSKHAAPQQR